MANPFAYEAITKTVTHVRNSGILDTVPQWANPIEHVNNIAIGIPIDSLAWITIAIAAGRFDIRERTARRVMIGAMILGAATQTFGELPVAQSEIVDTGLFSSSDADPIDLVYGLAGVAAFGAVTPRMMKKHYDARLMQHAGPSGIKIITDPGSFETQTIPLSFNS